MVTHFWILVGPKTYHFLKSFEFWWKLKKKKKSPPPQHFLSFFLFFNGLSAGWWDSSVPGCWQWSGALCIRPAGGWMWPQHPHGTVANVTELKPPPQHLNSDLVLLPVKYFSVVNPLSPELNPVKFFRHVISLLLVLQCHCSALHPVSEIGDTSLVQLLLEYKADPDLRNQVREDKFGQSVTPFLESSYGNKNRTWCQDASLKATVIYVDWFCWKEYFCSQHQETPLHLAVKNSHIPVIHSLLAAGCDINTTDDVRSSALASEILAKVYMSENQFRNFLPHCFVLFLCHEPLRGPRLLCTLRQSWAKSTSWRCFWKLDLI